MRSLLSRQIKAKNILTSLSTLCIAWLSLYLFTALSISQVHAKNTTTVNGIPVSTQLYYEHYQHLLKTHPHAKGKAKLEARLAKRALLPLVKELILKHEAQRLNISTENLEANKPIENLKKKYKTATSFQQYLVQVGETENSLRLKHWINALTYRLMKKSGDLAVTNEEVEVEYKRQQPLLKQAEKVKAYQILLKLPDHASPEVVNKVFTRAQELHQKLLDGSDFNILVQRYSEGALRSRNGDIGFVKRGDLIQNIEDELWRLNEEEFSVPLRTKYGWHIIKRGQKIEASQKSFEDVKDFLKDGLQQSKYRKGRRSFIKKLWIKSKIDSPIALRY